VIKGIEASSGISIKKGDLIDKVDKGSAAEKKGVSKGWRCVEVAGTAYDNAKDLTKALAAAKKGGKKYQIVCFRLKTDAEAAEEALELEEAQEAAAGKIQSVQRGNAARYQVASFKAAKTIYGHAMWLICIDNQLAWAGPNMALLAMVCKSWSTLALDCARKDSSCKELAVGLNFGMGYEINRLQDIGAAIQKALKAGKTPLLLDRTDDKKVNIDKLFEEGCPELWPSGAIVLNAKKMETDHLRGTAVGVIMEQARCALVQAQKEGKLLVVACDNTTPDFNQCFNDQTSADALDLEADDVNFSGKAVFPKEVFYAGGSVLTSGDWPDML